MNITQSTAIHRAAHKATAKIASPEKTATPVVSDPIDRVDHLISDLQSGLIHYSPEIAAGVRQKPLQLSDFPCKHYQVKPGEQIDTAHLPTEIVPHGEKPLYLSHDTIDAKSSLKHMKKDLEARRTSIHDGLQQLYAQETDSLLVMIDGDNAAGKDGLYRHTMELDPLTTLGAHGIKAPTGEAKNHAPEWRIMQILPGPGQVTLLNRSHYGDVVFGCKTEEQKRERLADIIETEYGLTMGLPMTPEGHIALPDSEGKVDSSAVQRPPMRIIKALPVISNAEQAHRFADRLKPGGKRYKASVSDVESHPQHQAIQAGYAEAMAAASRPWAPAYFIPNDLKPAGQHKLAQIVDKTLKAMDPHPAAESPDYTDAQATDESRRLDREYQAERNPKYKREH